MNSCCPLNDLTQVIANSFPALFWVLVLAAGFKVEGLPKMLCSVSDWLSLTGCGSISLAADPSAGGAVKWLPTWQR